MPQRLRKLLTQALVSETWSVLAISRNFQDWVLD